MKKLLIALVICLVASPIFAADIEKSDTQIQLEADASLTWKMNLDTYANGFQNTANLRLQFPLLAYQSLGKTPSDLYGSIDISNLSWIFADTLGDNNSTIANITGNIGAKLVFRPFELLIYNSPSLTYDLSSAGDLQGVANVSATQGSEFRFGTALKLVTEELPLNANLKVLSFGDNYNANAALFYAVGLDLDFFVIPDLLDIRTSMSSKFDGTGNFNFGAAFPLTFDLAEGFLVTPASDFEIDQGNFLIDASLNAELKFTQKNNQGGASTASFAAFMGSDYDLSLSAKFSEPADGGLIDYFGFLVGYSIVNFINNTDPAQIVEAESSVRIELDEYNLIIPQINFRYTHVGGTQVDRKSLTAGITYTNTAIDNTRIVIEWTPGTDAISLYDTLGEGFLVSKLEDFSFGTFAVTVVIEY